MHIASSENDDENAQLGNADPLCVDSPTMALDQVANWQRDCEKYHPEAVGPLFLYLAPDHYHKARVSGGAPYGIEVPNEAADALWENEEHDLHFFYYLRLCFQWGGFPRLPIERKILSDGMKKVVEHLKKDLVPF
jgi:hypothetical protein